MFHVFFCKHTEQFGVNFLYIYKLFTRYMTLSLGQNLPTYLVQLKPKAAWGFKLFRLWIKELKKAAY